MMQKHLELMFENSLLNVLIFDYQNLKLLYGSSSSLKIFNIGENRLSFIEIFPKMDINDLKTQLEDELSHRLQFPLHKDYTTEVYKVNILNEDLLVLSTQIKVSNKETCKCYNEGLKVRAVLDSDLKFIEIDKNFEACFGKLKSKHLSYNFINSFDFEYQQKLKKKLDENGTWFDGVALECKDGQYYPYFIIINKKQQDKTVVYDVNYFPHNLDSRSSFMGAPISISQPNVYGKNYFINISTKKLKNDDKEIPHKYLVFIDINNFKTINDLYGHLAGDHSIEQIGNIISYVFSNHTICFYGGDEFVILIDKKTTTENIIKKLKKVEIIIQEFVKFKPFGTKHIVCAGISRTPENGITISELIKKADQAMYRAKDEDKLYMLSY